MDVKNLLKLKTMFDLGVSNKHLNLVSFISLCGE